jgi:hypothetical protein
MLALDVYELTRIRGNEMQNLSFLPFLVSDPPYAQHPYMPKMPTDLYTAWHDLHNLLQECRMDLGEPCDHMPHVFLLVLDLKALINTSPQNAKQEVEKVLQEMLNLSFQTLHHTIVLEGNFKSDKLWELDWARQVLSCLSHSTPEPRSHASYANG